MGFEAEAVPIQEIRDGMFTMDMDGPFTFGATWEGLRLIGKSIGLFMLTDHFYTDPAVVDEVKAAAASGATRKEISEILRHASENQ